MRKYIGGEMIRKAKKKPVIIEYIIWDGTNLAEFYDFIGFLLTRREPEFMKKQLELEMQLGGLYIPTLEGSMKADIGDYIIKGVKGEVYPCKPEIFKLTYDEVE